MPSFGEDFWEMLLCHGGCLVDGVDIDTVYVWIEHNGHKRSPPVYRWYPRSLFKTLLLVSVAILFSPHF